MNICFLMYPWEKIRAETDSSLRLVHECARRGHHVALCTPGGLAVRDNAAQAICRVIQNNRISSSIPSFHRRAELKPSRLPLSGFDVIFVRLSPPLDGAVLNFLDLVRDDTLVINDVDGLRLAANKLYTAALADAEHDFIPTTHVSRQREFLERLVLESPHERMVLKPLNGSRGRGVVILEKNSRQSLRALLDHYIGEGDQGHFVVLQEYVSGAEQGDVRILMLTGEAIGAMRRLPAAGDARSNVHAGGTVKKHVLTRREHELCRHLGPRLVRDGLYFAGLDVIEGKLIEVNVLSPGGITRINRRNRTRLQERVIDVLENVVQAQEYRIQRKRELRKLVEDAHST
jgi:glutathione synthase